MPCVTASVTCPKEVRAATDDYLDTADDLGRYLEARTVPDPRARVGASELYRDYAWWCGEERLEPVNSTRFGLRLTARGIGKGRTSRNTVTREGIAMRDAHTHAVEPSLEEDQA